METSFFKALLKQKYPKKKKKEKLTEKLKKLIGSKNEKTKYKN